MWDLSCPDWQDRLRQGRPPIPDLPLIEDQARFGLAFFDEMQLPDVPATPRLGEAAGEWFRTLVRVAFGSWDPTEQARYIREIFCLAPKAQSKTSYAAALMLAVMLMNRRWNAEALFVGPTQSISDRAYDQAAGMIELAPALKRRFETIDHAKTIRDRINRSEMRVKTFDANVLTGAILIFALLDELHLLGRSAHTTKVMRQIRGGLDKTPEGLLLITTTQSDDRPAGAFKDELMQARRIRDGVFRGVAIRPMLPVIYEFPPEIAGNREEWEKPSNWPMVLPNLGRSVHLRDLVPDWESEKGKGEHATRIWASQHLNIEIGLGLHSDRWRGADYWEEAADPELTLDTLLEKSELVVIGIDDGGLDDLLGLTVLGREKGTRDWLSWSRAWAHGSVFEQRKSEASRLGDFVKDGDLVTVDRLTDAAEEVADLVERIVATGLVPAEGGIGQDQYGPRALVATALAGRGLDVDHLIVGVPQGWKITGAIKDAEVRLADGSFRHADQPLMDWCVGNARIEARGNAVLITKQAAGAGKIDPLAALLDAIVVMQQHPETTRSAYEERELLVL